MSIILNDRNEDDNNDSKGKVNNVHAGKAIIEK